MSNLTVATLTGPPSQGGNIFVPGGRVVTPGAVLQTLYVRTDTRATYSSSNSGNGNPVTPLNLTITPRLSNSLILCQWMVNGELHQDNVWLIWKDGALASNGFNTSIGNIRTSGYAAGFYDQNEDSTPSNWKFIYADYPNTTTPVTYGLAVRSSSSGNYTLALNRTIASSTGDAYESMVSVGVIQEIAQ